MRVLGLDIGGANLKVALCDGDCLSIAMPLWKDPQLLPDLLRALPEPFSILPDLIAMTMTAELADCFHQKEEGVRYVIQSVVAAFPGVPVRIWLTSGEFAEPDDAVDLAGLVASANWHALATWAGRAVPEGPGLLVDVGSTTTDIIPLIDGMPMSAGKTDIQRLEHRELVYTGAERTPVCAMVQRVPWRGTMVQPAAELFATALDIHLITGAIAERPTDCGTADGRPATRQHALNRLARMICCDRTEVTEQQLEELAAWVARQQVHEIALAVCNRLEFLTNNNSLANNSSPCGPAAGAGRLITVPVSGSGHFLALKALEQAAERYPLHVMNLAAMYRPGTATAACAFAVARLSAERCSDDLLPLSRHSG